MRASSFLFILLLLSASILASASVRIEQDGLIFERSLSVVPMDSINPSTGVVRQLEQTVITLTLSNPGQTDRTSVVLTEDLTYLPSYVRLSFGTAPARTDGRTASWTLPVLPAGRSVSYSISLPLALPDSALRAALPPKIAADRLPARLDAPAQVDLGQNVALTLRLAHGEPLAGARIEVTSPGTQRFVLTTDSQGRAFFNANQSGFYSYSTPDFSLPFSPATQSREPPPPAAPAAGAIVPAPAETPSSPAFSLDAAGLWPIAGGLLFVGVLAFGLYAYFNRPSSEEPSAPPASAARPFVSESRPAGSPSDSGPVASRAGSDEPLPSLSSASSPPSSISGQPPSIPSTLSSASAAPSASPSSSAELLGQTRDMLASRRSRPASASDSDTVTSSAPSPAPDTSDAVSPFSPPAAASAPPALSARPSPAPKPDYSEQTSVSEPSGPEPDEEEEAPSGPRPPSWVTSPASLSAESTEVDDEAIAKTIAELEALREELRGRSASRQAPNGEKAEDLEEADSQEEEDDSAAPAHAASEEGESESAESGEDSNEEEQPANSDSGKYAADTTDEGIFKAPPSSLSETADASAVSDALVEVEDDEEAEIAAILSAHPLAVDEEKSAGLFAGPEPAEQEEEAEAPSEEEEADESEPSGETPASDDEPSGESPAPPAQKQPSAPARAPPSSPALNTLRRLQRRLSHAGGPEKKAPVESAPASKPSVKPTPSILSRFSRPPPAPEHPAPRAPAKKTKAIAKPSAKPEPSKRGPTPSKSKAKAAQSKPSKKGRR